MNRSQDRSFALRTAVCLMFCIALPSVSQAATVPYSESFEGYAVGDTAVANFTEMSTSAWTIVSPGISGKSYENALSVFSPGIGVAAGQAASSAIEFPSLASSTFTLHTRFRLDSLTLTGSYPGNTATVGLIARSADATPASTSADRYQLSYFLDDDDAGHATGRLWLREDNLFFGSSFDAVSSSSLPVTIGDTYMLSLTGTQSGGSITLVGTLTNETASGSISVSATDSANLLAGSYFGYLDHAYVNAGGTTAVHVAFDDFAAVPEPSIPMLLVAGFAAASIGVWRKSKIVH
ncbi:MAG: hypothetical protein IT426_06850 [Pirellulales bacterium]|nr:hypothetical protein [Pirellulales bacterium]